MHFTGPRHSNNLISNLMDLMISSVDLLYRKKLGNIGSVCDLSKGREDGDILPQLTLPKS